MIKTSYLSLSHLPGLENELSGYYKPLHVSERIERYKKRAFIHFFLSSCVFKHINTAKPLG